MLIGKAFQGSFKKETDLKKPLVFPFSGQESLKLSLIKGRNPLKQALNMVRNP